MTGYSVEPWHLIALPIISQAHRRQRFYDFDPETINPEELLTEAWVARAMYYLKATVLDSDLASIAMEVGVLNQLLEAGVQVTDVPARGGTPS